MQPAGYQSSSSFYVRFQLISISFVLLFPSTIKLAIPSPSRYPFVLFPPVVGRHACGPWL